MAQTNEQVEMVKLVGELKENTGKLIEEHKSLGEQTAETKKTVEAIQTQLDALDEKVTKAKLGNIYNDDGREHKSVGQRIIEQDDFQNELKSGLPSLRSKNGRLIIPYDGKPLLEKRSLITTTAGLTVSTTGVQQLTRLPGITGIAKQALRVRDLMTYRTCEGSSFDFVKQSTRTNAASPQTEGSAKGESTYAWTSSQGTVQEIAHFVNVTKQALADVAYLQNTLNDELLYGLELELEHQLLFGDNAGSHLNGIQTQATAYNFSNVSGDTKLDILRHAKLQARLAGLATYAPDAYVLHPQDIHTIELIKDETGGANKGRYIIGDPRTGAEVMLLWGLPVVESDSIAQGNFLCGCFAQAEFIDRQQAVVDISYEHSSNFTANLATIRAELRAGIAVRVPGASIKGTY